MVLDDGSRQISKNYQDLLGDIANSFSSFHASEAAIAHAVLDHPDEVAGMNISQLATFSETSAASVVRFSKAMGFKGFPDFRMALVSELSKREHLGIHGNELDGGITIQDSPEEVIRKISQADARAIQSTAERLDVGSFVATVDLWEKAEVIGLIGVASSGYVVMDLQLKLNRLGKNAIAWRDAHSALTSISVLKPNDVLVAVSHSGTTVDIVDVITEFKARGVKIVLITNGLRSPSSALADVVLYTSARETTFRSGATASRIAQLTVVDCLCVALAQRNWRDTKAALDLSREAIGSRSGKKPTI
ncbi:MAG: MurR/RpiR family transcriptional regulator [Candidatus Nanopelagicaceae bacterium]|nr:MurR/RpiR family transcriptional regulator [Candidatus Nanopelagicaceae bacterium]